MKPQIALQLYTLRESLAQDFPGTLQRIANMGFRHVESAFWPEGMDVQTAARLIHEAGLSVMAAHIELPLGEQQGSVLEALAALGCTRAVWHGWPQSPDYSSLAGIERLAEQYNASNEVLRSHGYSFGLHNHWWEFEPVEGRYPYEVLLERIDPSIFFEVDTYWVKTAGRDPVQVVTQLGDRAPLLHIKDGPAVKGASMVAAGDGSQDFPAILQAAPVAEWLIIELDRCETDMVMAVARSYQYLTQMTR